MSNVIGEFSGYMITIITLAILLGITCLCLATVVARATARSSVSIEYMNNVGRSVTEVREPVRRV